MNTISDLRKKHQITQEELAKAISVSHGVPWSIGRVSHYEINRTIPKLKQCRMFVTAFNSLGVKCTLDDVFPPEQSEAA